MEYGNARHPARDPVTPAPNGPLIGGNAIAATVTLLGPDPIAQSYIGRLFFVSSLASPAASGRFRPGDKGSMDNREHRDIGPLQEFTGKALIARSMLSRLGAQGGPGDQPAYPGTGSTVAPSIRTALAGMELPQILRT